jgi:hypothetical protein
MLGRFFFKHLAILVGGSASNRRPAWVAVEGSSFPTRDDDVKNEPSWKMLDGKLLLYNSSLHLEGHLTATIVVRAEETEIQFHGVGSNGGTDSLQAL